MLGSSAHRGCATVGQLIAMALSIVVLLPLSPAAASGDLKWRVLRTPSAADPGQDAGFTGVSCWSALNCFAVIPPSQPGDSGGNLPFGVAPWIGLRWTTGGTVSCAVTSICMTVNTSEDFREVGLNASLWNGTTLVALPPPSGLVAAGSVVPSGVSCPSVNECVVVGNEIGGLFVATWNGNGWSLGSLPAPAGADLSESNFPEQGVLGPVSCSSAVACTAVGNANGLAFADRWDGHTWSLQSIPLPAGGVVGALSGISCPSSDDCTAVGSWSGAPDPTGNQDSHPYIVQWTGANWTVDPTQVSSTTTLRAMLLGVSCVAQNACVAVGYGAPPNTPPDSSIVYGPVVEQWDGASWSYQLTSISGGQRLGGGDLDAVSCITATVCFAVGEAMVTTDKEAATAIPFGETTSPPGSARLGRTPAPCAAQPFSALVTGANIAAVHWSLDKRPLRGRALRRARSYWARIILPPGPHTLDATVTFQASAFTPNVTFRRAVSGCKHRNLSYSHVTEPEYRMSPIVSDRLDPGSAQP